MGATLRVAFLLTIHGPGEPAVLENLRTRERARIDDLAEIGAQVERWLTDEPDRASDRRAGQDPLVQAHRLLGGLDAELVDQDAAAGEELA